MTEFGEAPLRFSIGEIMNKYYMKQDGAGLCTIATRGVRGRPYYHIMDN
jgi:hypothetical protein